MPDENTLRERLKQSISNSRKKKYHGNEGDINVIPKIDEQAKALLEEGPSPFINYDKEKKQFVDAKDPSW